MKQNTARAIGFLAKVSLATTGLLICIGAGGCPGPAAPSGPPFSGPFSFTADRSSVNIPVNTLSSDVTFTLTSDGTFSGQVVVSWTATGDCTPSPADNDVTYNVTPAAPTTFTRKMYRWSDNGRNVRFTATHQPSSVSESLDIAYTH
ncbi:MAG TPA: hypothetical protein PKA27_12355 [Fimbriimonadaceae bacterium]|nr:hypothetical protein [Fimbriimonadaceae bacterium]